jgi:type I restriction enzyme, S subunit
MSNSTNNATIGNAITILSGFPFPSAQFTDRPAKALIRIRDLLAGRTETNFEGDFDPVFLVRRDDVLIGMDGDFNVVRWKGPEALLNQRVCKISSASEEIDERFLYWWLKPHVETIHRRTPQTTVRHLSVGDLYRIPKPSLTITAQAVAAAVLDTVDEAIAKTEGVIAKLKQVRAGLLHDLLTRGLDERGQLRDPIARPHQFCESVAGLIPRSWSVRPIKECLISHPQNGLYKPARQIGYGVLLIGQTCIAGDRMLDISEARRVELSLPELDRFALRENDILISRVFATLAGIGLPALVPALAEPAVYESNMMRLRVDTAVIIPCLLFEMLRTHRVRARIVAAAHLSNQASINQSGLNPIPICVPPPEEQRVIVTRIAAADEFIKATKSELTKLEYVKLGLMTDLLTGRVRVPESVSAVENQP